MSATTPASNTNVEDAERFVMDNLRRLGLIEGE